MYPLASLLYHGLWLGFGRVSSPRPTQIGECHHVVLWAQSRMEMQKDGNNICSLSSTAKCHWILTTPWGMIRFTYFVNKDSELRLYDPEILSWVCYCLCSLKLKYRNLEWTLRSLDIPRGSEYPAYVCLHSWHMLLADIANWSYCSFPGILDKTLESFLK